MLEIEKEIVRLKKIIKAKDMLLVAYRLNDQRRAVKAIDELDRLGKVENEKAKNKHL